MKQYNFIISYDISDDKRLRKIAKILEKQAIRIQFSIFYYPKATKQELHNLLEKILQIYDPKQDDIRVYNIKDSGITLGSGIDLNNPYNFF